MNESTPTAPAAPAAEPELVGNDVADVLDHLAATAEDGAKGFTEAAERVDNATIESLFRELGTERSVFAEELRGLMAARYETYVPASGSIKGAVHRGWLAVKDAVTGSDTHALVAAAESGEDYAVEQWAEAIEKPLPADVAAMVRRQFQAVKLAHDRVKGLEVATDQ